MQSVEKLLKCSATKCQDQCAIGGECEMMMFAQALETKVFPHVLIIKQQINVKRKISRISNKKKKITRLWIMVFFILCILINIPAVGLFFIECMLCIEYNITIIYTACI